MRAVFAVCAVVSTVALSGCDPMSTTGGPGPSMASGPEHQCFNVQQVENFRQGGTGVVYLRVRGDRVYEVNTAGGCLDLDFANRLAITPDLTGIAGGRICTGDSARIIVPGSTSAASVCRVRVERVLTAEEVAALPRGSRP